MFFRIVSQKLRIFTMWICFTGPNPPQNITVTNVTSSHVALSWAAPDSTQDALFEQYFLYWLDEATGRGRGLWLNRRNLSAVIGGLEAYHIYRVSLVSVTAEGVESSEATPLVVITGKICLFWHSLIKRAFNEGQI